MLRLGVDADLLAVADTKPEIVIDDGAELTARIVEHRPELAAGLAGVTEETTTGVARLRAMEAAGKLTFPAIAANDALSKHLFDNRYGTGQSTLAAIDRLTNLNFAGREFCIVGYGWVGKGLARAARGAGGRVTVVEIEPVAALEAHMDGNLKDGVVIANGGHHEREIAIDGLGAGEEVRPGVTEHVLPGGGHAYVLAEGRQTNVAGGDGHPVEIMDLSFSVQALAAHLLARGGLEPGLHSASGRRSSANSKPAGPSSPFGTCRGQDPTCPLRTISRGRSRRRTVRLRSVRCRRGSPSPRALSSCPPRYRKSRR